MEIKKLSSDNPSDVYSAAHIFGRLIFGAELAASAAVVFGVGWIILHGAFHDLLPGALFCFSFVLTIIVDNVVKRSFMHRRPLFGIVVSVLLALLFAGAGAGLVALSWGTPPPPGAGSLYHH